MKIIDIENWSRKDQFHYFNEFELPYFNVVMDVDVTALKDFAKEHKLSFFLCSFYVLLKAVNQTEEFRFRIRDGQVVCHDIIRGGCPIMKDDGNFSFTHLDYLDSFEQYYKISKAKVDEIKKGAPFLPGREQDDVFHSSVVPWFSFRQFEHAKRFKNGDTVPKFVIGKFFEKDGKWLMPLSVAAHHALVDGLHVANLFKLYEDIAGNPSQHLSS